MSPQPLAQWQDLTLQELRSGSESVLASGLAYRPLTHALCAVQYDGKILLVHNQHRQTWELPGGELCSGIDAGELVLQKVFEETCQRPLEMWFRGLACYTKGPQAEAEYGALYCGRPSQLYPFKASPNIDQIHWWTPGESLEGLNPLAAALAASFGPESL